MNNVKIFENAEFGSIRVTELNGEAWFVGKDVADVLGYERGTKAVVDHIDEDDRLMIDGTTQSQFGIELGQRGGWLINESGLYSLVLSSKLPTAKKFKRWVTSEVLPSIRKHGAYMTPEKLEEALLDPDTLIRLATDLKQEREQRIAAQAKIETDKPKVLFADAVCASQSSILVGNLAKLLKQNGVDMGQNRLFAYLRDNGYLMKRGSSRNMPTQKSMELGLFEVKESSITNPDGSIRITKTTKVTGKGQVYFVNQLKAMELVG